MQIFNLSLDHRNTAGENVNQISAEEVSRMMEYFTG
jgi:hypothetical protein